MSLPELLSTRDVCSVLHCCQKTLRRMYRNGLFPTPKIIGRRRFFWTRDTVLSWLQGREDETLSTKTAS